MTSDEGRPRGRRLLLAADAFLFGAALNILITALLIGVLFAVFHSPAGIAEGLGPLWGSVLSLVFAAASVFGGALAAWRLQTRPVTGTTIASMVAGVVIGIVVVMPVFSAGAMLLSRLPGLLGIERAGDGPPWLAIGVLAALALAFLGVPLVDAVRDLRASRRSHVRLDVLRLVALAVVVLLAVVALPLAAARFGGELGEAGIFMIPFAAAAAFAVLGADIVSSMRERRRPPAEVPAAE